MLIDAEDLGVDFGGLWDGWFDGLNGSGLGDLEYEEFEDE